MDQTSKTLLRSLSATGIVYNSIQLYKAMLDKSSHSLLYIMWLFLLLITCIGFFGTLEE